MIEFANGAALFEQTTAKTPDLIVMDAELEGVDGFQTFSRLQHQPGGSVGVVFLTRFEHPGVAEICKRRGALDYLGKSQSFDGTVEAIRAALATQLTQAPESAALDSSAGKRGRDRLLWALIPAALVVVPLLFALLSRETGVKGPIQGGRGGEMAARQEGAGRAAILPNFRSVRPSEAVQQDGPAHSPSWEPVTPAPPASSPQAEDSIQTTAALDPPITTQRGEAARPPAARARNQSPTAQQVERAALELTGGTSGDEATEQAPREDAPAASSAGAAPAEGTGAAAAVPTESDREPGGEPDRELAEASAAGVSATGGTDPQPAMESGVSDAGLDRDPAEPLSEPPDYSLAAIRQRPQYVPVDARALPRSRLRPQYPRALADRKLGGTVTLWVLVDDAGKVEDVRILRSSKQPELDRSAIEAIRRATYNAAHRDGSAVASWTQQQIVFRLD